VHDRVIFAGDSAHVVSPFGARGGNGGIQDADNLGWKLAAVVKGEASAALLESYNEERTHGADENILNSARTTNFMSAASPAEKLFRSEVLALAKDMPFARRLINSGRLSQPCSLEGLSLQTDSEGSPLAVGSPCADAPLSHNEKPGFLLGLLGGGFSLLTIGTGPDIDLENASVLNISTDGNGEHDDSSGLISARYGEGWTYLIRPDQHVAAAWKNPSRDEVLKALARAKGCSDV
jgi:3-(3-hydroxy-phenyl)propionate hydroxylase